MGLPRARTGFLALGTQVYNRPFQSAGSAATANEPRQVRRKAHRRPLDSFYAVLPSTDPACRQPRDPHPKHVSVRRPVTPSSDKATSG